MRYGPTFAPGMKLIASSERAVVTSCIIRSAQLWRSPATVSTAQPSFESRVRAPYPFVHSPRATRYSAGAILGTTVKLFDHHRPARSARAIVGPILFLVGA